MKWTLMKKLGAIGAGILTVTTLAACGNSAPSNEIVLWTSTTGPDGDLILENINRFNETDPEFPVRLQTMEGGTMFNRLATSTRSGEGVPDLAMIASETLPMFHGQGLLQSWDEHLGGTAIQRENYLDTSWDLGAIEGEQFGIPVSITSWIMYYNRELVDKYAPGALDDGIITYEEILEAGSAAVDDVLALGFTWPMQNVTNLYMQKGGSFSEGGRPTFDNDISAATFETFKELHDRGYMNQHGEDAIALFKSGQLMFLPEGTWMISDMQQITNFEWGMTLTPQWDADNLVQGSGIGHFTMFRSEERSDEKIQGIVEFIEWLQTNQLEWLESGANPVSLAMLDNEAFLEMPQSFLMIEERYRESLTVIIDPGSSQIFGEIDGAAWDMISGNSDIRERLREIQQTVEDQMNQNQN